MSPAGQVIVRGVRGHLHVDNQFPLLQFLQLIWWQHHLLPSSWSQSSERLLDCVCNGVHLKTTGTDAEEAVSLLLTLRYTRGPPCADLSILNQPADIALLNPILALGTSFYRAGITAIN